MNASTQFLTRRALCRIFGLASLLRIFRAPASGAAKLQWEEQPDERCATRRTYRADAQVLLLSVPLLRRSGVGAGSATWSEDAGVRFLDFTGYSLPERAVGLNRFGLIRELSRIPGDAAECIYFGLMTASPEETAAEARNALRAQAKTLLYSAIQGCVAPGVVATTTAHFTAPAALSVSQPGQLLEMAQQALSAASSKPPEFAPGAQSDRTFLQALAGLLQKPSGGETLYIYSGRLYRLWLCKSPDPKATAYFHDRRLISPEAKVIRAEGKLRRETGGKETSFQLWVEEAAARPLPLRIEYQAKSYLRLVFEANDSFVGRGLTDCGRTTLEARTGSRD
jgi:hypothetical protein